MVDIHSHILPEIDDGAESLEEFLAMCKMAYQDGIRTIVATPHVGKFPNTKEIILDKTAKLKAELISHKIELNLLSGSDIEFSSNLFSLIENNSLLTINNSRYLLLDTPYFLMPPNIEKFIELILSKGLVPIISHPERCLQIQENPEILYKIVKAGALVQITAASITGKMGKEAKESTFLILRHSLAQIIASDSHGINNRPPILSAAVNVASGIVGKDIAEAMVTTIPQAIIEDKPLMPK